MGVATHAAVQALKASSTCVDLGWLVRHPATAAPVGGRLHRTVGRLSWVDALLLLAWDNFYPCYSPTSTGEIIPICPSVPPDGLLEASHFYPSTLFADFSKK